MLAYPDALSTNPGYRDFPHGEDYNPASSYPASLLVPEYTLIEQAGAVGGIIDTFSVLYPHLQDINFRRDVPGLDVPGISCAGRVRVTGALRPGRGTVRAARCPTKELVVFPQSGHAPHLDEPSRFHEFLSGTVLAESDRSR